MEILHSFLIQLPVAMLQLFLFGIAKRLLDRLSHYDRLSKAYYSTRNWDNFFVRHDFQGLTRMSNEMHAYKI